VDVHIIWFRTTTHLCKIILNDSNDKLNLGEITTASGVMLAVTGYGTHKLLGNVLIVPSFLVDMTISVGCLDTAGYALTISNGVVKIIGNNGNLVMLGFKNNNNVYTIQRFYPPHFLPMSFTSHDISLPECNFNLTIIPKANQSNLNTPNRVSWLYNTFTPPVNSLRSSTSHQTPPLHYK